MLAKVDQVFCLVVVLGLGLPFRYREPTLYRLTRKYRSYAENLLRLLLRRGSVPASGELAYLRPTPASEPPGDAVG